MRSRRIAFAIVLALAVSLVVWRSYADNMDVSDSTSISHPDPKSWSDRDLTVANLGHASVLMNYFGTRVLSDPSLFSRMGLSFDSMLTIGPKRVTDPPVAPEQLQTLDAILITHAHMDHLDVPSLKRLPKSAVVVTCEKCSKIVAPLGFKDVRELKWGDTTTVSGLQIRAMGARHWGKRWPPYGTDYGFNSYLLEKNGRRTLLACDSAETDLFAVLAGAPPDLAIFSIGAYDPWIWNHANPEQVWSMFLQTGARYLMPIHWGTFKLSREPMEEPLQRLIAAAGDQQGRIVVREIGGVWTLPATDSASHTDRQAAGR